MKWVLNWCLILKVMERGRSNYTGFRGLRWYYTEKREKRGRRQKKERQKEEKERKEKEKKGRKRKEKGDIPADNLLPHPCFLLWSPCSFLENRCPSEGTSPDVLVIISVKHAHRSNIWPQVPQEVFPSNQNPINLSRHIRKPWELSYWPCFCTMPGALWLHDSFPMISYMGNRIYLCIWRYLRCPFKFLIVQLTRKSSCQLSNHLVSQTFHRIPNYQRENWTEPTKHPTWEKIQAALLCNHPGPSRCTNG